MNTRTRQVFPRDRVSHLWAHGIQDSARDAGGNFFFNGSTLYSYGSHFVIAHRLSGEEYGPLNGRILWNDESRSNTTSKHQNVAWRALTRQQRDTRLNLPSMNQDTARGIDRAIREKRLPTDSVSAALLSTIQGHIVALSGKRHGSGPFIECLFLARKYDATARALYAAAGKKYPLAAIPENNDDIPADKAGRDAFIAEFAKPLIRQYLADARKNAADALRVALENKAIGCRDTEAANYTFQNYLHSAERGLLECVKANKHYSTLNPGKRDPQAAKISKALQPLADAFKVALTEAEKRLSIGALADIARRYFSAQRKIRNGEKNARRYMPIAGTLRTGASIRDAINFVGLPDDSMIIRAANRVLRIESVDTVNGAKDHFLRNIATADSYGEKYPADAMRCTNDAIRYLLQIERLQGGYARYVSAKLAPLATGAREKVNAYQTQILEREKQRIADWISGASNARPAYKSGTYARIKGGIVETTGGASVPIEHACRLARVFDRIVSAGGKNWPDGSGPMVGHYRVNVIGADGSLVIGCHKFTPTEAKRLRDVLASCADCANVTETA